MDDAFPVALVCGVDLRSGQVGGVGILRYMLGWPSAGGDGYRWTASRVLSDDA